MKKRKFEGPPVSSEFVNSLTGSGATCMTCSYCDREHIAIDSCNITCDDYSGDYLMSRSELFDMATADPETYVLVSNVDFIHGVDLDGMLFPDDCPCNGLRQYEDFIWENRSKWFSYYALRKLSLESDLRSLDGV